MADIFSILSGLLALALLLAKEMSMKPYISRFQIKLASIWTTSEKNSEAPLDVGGVQNGRRRFRKIETYIFGCLLRYLRS